MAYQALYRKWRPMTFDDVIGQSHIVNTLKNEVTEGRTAHAYLFTGTRGTGKTSTAKILSRAVNCVNTTDGNPCNECDICKGILDGSNLDIIEIDAASNTGVDNIRDIIEQCRYASATSKYKIYIIDEVHMLSTGAFNALLKTLEEPPSHVIFILATTEIHMVPATILSRCQRFDFSVISIIDIVSAMKRILGEEGICVTDDALEYVAYLGNGSMRDSLSILDRCIAFKSGGIDYEDVVSIVGAMDDAYLYKFAGFIADGDTASLLVEFDKCVQKGKTLDNFAADLLNCYRELLNYKVAQSSFNCSAKKLELIKSVSESYTQEKIVRCIYLITDLIHDLRFSSNPRVLIECTMIKMANPAFDTDVASLLERISALEDKLAKGITVVQKQEQVTAPQTPPFATEFDGFEPPAEDDFYPDIQPADVNTEPVANAEVSADAEEKTDISDNSAASVVINNWAEVIAKVQEEMHLTLYFHISEAVPVKSPKGVMICFPDSDIRSAFDRAKEVDILKDIIRASCGVDVVVTTGVIGEEVYEEPENVSENSVPDIFSNLAMKSGEFPDNIKID